MTTRTRTLLAGLAGLLIGALAMALAMPLGRSFGWGPGSLPRAGQVQGGMGQMPGGMQMGQMPGGMQGGMGQQNSLVGVAATSLGMDRQALIAELQGGKTIAQVAEAKGVATDVIVNAFVTTREQRLSQAVSTGMISQADADSRLATARAMASSRLAQRWSPQQGQRGGPGMGQRQACGPGMGQRQGCGQGQGNCSGAGFVDADGDGICDNAP
jgi:hypothetical protein